MNEELIKLREKAEAYFKSRWKGRPCEEVSDFGAYCVEQWLSGRNTKTSFQYLGIDYLRSFAHRTGARGSSDLLAQPTRLAHDSETRRLAQHGADAIELRRFDESSLLRDRRLPERQRLILILYYEWGFSLKEIGDLLAVSESRVSYLLNEALSAQKKRISSADASEEERNRQRVQSKALSREVQVRSIYHREAKDGLAAQVEPDEPPADPEKVRAILAAAGFGAPRRGD